MNTVEPIRDRAKIDQMKNNLKSQKDKYYIMFVIGINTGLRISDLRMLRVKDVLGKEHINIREQKTGKQKRFLINSMLQEEIQAYVSKNGKTEEEYLIQSQKGENKPLSRGQAYNILHHAARKCGITDCIGTHTMRKTFGYWYYKQYQDIAMLQDIFNHSSPSVTMRYIGINEDIKDSTLRNFYL